MKKIIIICFAALLLSSCSDNFLELYPRDKITAATFYKTESDFTQAVNGVYASLRGVYQAHGYMMCEMRSDNTHYTRYEAGRGIPSTDAEDVADFDVKIQNERVREMWKACYAGISRANTILDQIDGVNLSVDFKNSIKGQTKFMRSFFYFQLVQCFGRVPLQLSEVKSSETAFTPQSSVDEVYTAIIRDVTDAINEHKLPKATFAGDKKQASGAATEGAARMLYAYVLMTKPTRDYAAAEKELKEVMKMGYDLMPKFSDVFEPSLKNSVEHIFAIQYQMGEQGQQSEWMYHFVPKARAVTAKIVTGVENEDTMGGGWNVPTPAMVALYADNDLRRNTSIGMAVGTLEEAGVMVIEAVYNIGDPKIANYPLAIPFINKYRHAHIKKNNTDDNWPVYRYSDALLLMAECLVEQGRAAEAAPYINQVRKRAGLTDLDNITAQKVADERRIELAFENHRWFDLIRTGKAFDVMTAYATYIKTIDPKLPAHTYQITKDALLYPIPYRELLINKQLTQNPGY